MLDIDLDKVLAEFGKALGMALAFDGNGACALAVDDETPVIVQANRDDSSLVLSSALRGELPEAMNLRKVGDLLALALDPLDRGGASPVVGRDPESGMVVLYAVLPPSVLARAPLAELFSNFMTTRKAVAAMLDEPVEAPPSLEDAFSKMWA
jgi:hypothetical protein